MTSPIVLKRQSQVSFWFGAALIYTCVAVRLTDGSLCSSGGNYGRCAGKQPLFRPGLWDGKYFGTKLWPRYFNEPRLLPVYTLGKPRVSQPESSQGGGAESPIRINFLEDIVVVTPKNPPRKNELKAAKPPVRLHILWPNESHRESKAILPKVQHGFELEPTTALKNPKTGKDFKPLPLRKKKQYTYEDDGEQVGEYVDDDDYPYEDYGDYEDGSEYEGGRPLRVPEIFSSKGQIGDSRFAPPIRIIPVGSSRSSRQDDTSSWIVGVLLILLFVFYIYLCLCLLLMGMYKVAHCNRFRPVVTQVAPSYELMFKTTDGEIYDPSNPYAYRASCCSGRDTTKEKSVITSNINTSSLISTIKPQNYGFPANNTSSLMSSIKPQDRPGNPMLDVFADGKTGGSDAFAERDRVANILRRPKPLSDNKDKDLLNLSSVMDSKYHPRDGKSGYSRDRRPPGFNHRSDIPENPRPSSRLQLSERPKLELRRPNGHGQEYFNRMNDSNRGRSLKYLESSLMSPVQGPRVTNVTTALFPELSRLGTKLRERDDIPQAHPKQNKSQGNLLRRFWERISGAPSPALAGSKRLKKAIFSRVKSKPKMTFSPSFSGASFAGSLPDEDKPPKPDPGILDDIFKRTSSSESSSRAINVPRRRPSSVQTYFSTKRTSRLKRMNV